MNFSLILPSFIAGLLTFLAPCTLPLAPAYLSFISGVSLKDLEDTRKSRKARWKIFLNGLLFIVGFSIVFIVLGTLAGLGGRTLIQYRFALSRLGGILVIIFGLFMMNVVKIPILNQEKKIRAFSVFGRGAPVNSFLFGATFAFGWTPCVGPILGSVLTLAAASTTVAQGTILLAIFSLGLAIPFLAIALGVSQASMYVKKISKYLQTISFVGGVFLVFLGILLLTNTMNIWVSFFYRVFHFINYDRLLDYL